MAFSLPDTKTIIDLVKTGMTIEAQEKIMELRETAVALKAENTDLKEALAELQKKLDLKGRIEWTPPFYFLRDGEKKDGPYCQHCYDKNGEMIRLQFFNNGKWVCLSCKNPFYDENFKPPLPRKVSSSYSVRM